MKNKLNRVFTVLFIVALFVVGVEILLIVKARLANSQMGRKVSDIKLTKDILFESQPISGIEGKLTTINNNIITVTHHYILSDTVGNVAPEEKARNVTFQFALSPQTKIFRPPTYIPYLFKINQENREQMLTIADLKPGMFIDVTTNGDLRVAQSAPFTAISIQVTRIANNISGTISAVTGNTVTVTALLPPLPASFPPQPSTSPQTYTVHITADTEISQREYNEGAPRQLDTSSLITGAPITVYTSQDTGVEHDINALLIAVFDRRPAPASISPKLP